MDRVLVTGGAGFIGSNFIRHLLKETDCNVVNLDKLTYAGNLNNIKDVRREKRHEFVRGDIGNQKLVDSLVRKMDSVVNFAAESHIDRSIQASRVFVGGDDSSTDFQKFDPAERIFGRLAATGSGEAIHPSVLLAREVLDPTGQALRVAS